MKPLIKWPGGKSREISKVIPNIPDQFNRYIEPFVGGGAVLFHLEHENNVINDVDENLTSFYSNIKDQDETFFETLDAIACDWEGLQKTTLTLSEFFVNMKRKAIQQKKRGNKISQQYFREKLDSILPTIKLKSNIFSGETFRKYLITSVSSKIIRIASLEIKKQEPVTERWTYDDHLENSVKSAYYMMLRDEDVSDEKIRNAIFFFIREYCYGSMFRYNARGRFNIPYGGNAYNKKSFRKKVDRLRSEEVQSLLKKTQIYNLDFGEFLSEISPQQNDFVFFDPPYDSEFKDYSMNPFTRDDHRRLANHFATLPSMNLMIIGRSNFIQNLYSEMQRDVNPDIQIIDYRKVYSYNVRGRNSRRTNHLLISNFPITI